MEVLVSSTIFIFLVGGIVTANLFGLRMFQITGNKLSATDYARKTIGKMADEIRTCRATSLGDIQGTNFVDIVDGERQEASALMIQPTTNAANFIIYFLNPSDQTFRRTTSDPDSAVILAESVTNNVIFSSRDLSGNILTNNLNNRVIHFELEFYQPSRFLRIADYYRLETAVTRRAKE